MRSVLYLTIAILAGLIGFTISQTIISFTPTTELIQRAEYILFPITSAFLASSTVVAEIFLNNPTRRRRNQAILPQPLACAVAIGLGSGLLAAVMSDLFTYWPQLHFGATVAKALGWMLIGVGAGVADGYSWRFRTIEGGQQLRAKRRLLESTIFGAFAGLIAFFVSEFLFNGTSTEFLVFKDVLGFLVLGGCLGLFLDRVGSGALCFALRAGAGFEAIKDLNQSRDFSRINHSQLRFNCTPPPLLDLNSEPIEIEGLERKIEEGMSIELPRMGEIKIGSHQDSDIFISILPRHCATITLANRQAYIEAHGTNYVRLRRRLLPANSKEPLSHNQVLTLYVDRNRTPPITEFVRFVFYDRFLDPQS